MAKSININEIFRKIADFFRNLPERIMDAPNDEKAAYGAVGLGSILFIAGLVLMIMA